MDVNHVSKSWHDPPSHGLLRLKKTRPKPTSRAFGSSKTQPDTCRGSSRDLTNLTFHKFSGGEFSFTHSKGGVVDLFFFRGFQQPSFHQKTTYPKKGVSIVKPMEFFLVLSEQRP